MGVDSNWRESAFEVTPVPRSGGARGGFVARLGLLAALGLVITASAQAVDLGDLRVSPDRIPAFHGIDTVDTKSWPVYDVTNAATMSALGCSTADKADNGSSDAGAVNCAVAAVPDNSVVFLPTGTYNHIGDRDAIKIDRSNVVVRGAGVGRSFLKIANFIGDAAGGCAMTYARGLAFSVCKNGFKGNGVTWTSGFNSFDTTIGVSNTAPFQVGGWVWMATDSDAGTCSLVDVELSGASAKSYFRHIAKVVAIGSNSITIDRGLRMDYVCRSNAQVKPFTPLSNVGIEGLTVEHTNSTDLQLKFRTPVSFEGVVDSWIRGSEFRHWSNQTIHFTDSARNLIEGNHIEDVQQLIWNTTNIGMRTGAVDNVIENNTCVASKVCVQNGAGAEGNVIAYNYMRNAATNGERAIFNHGSYTREILMEGNDVDTAMVGGDRWWGRHGPRITIFKNRVYGTPSGKSAIETNRDGAVGCNNCPISDRMNIIGNISHWFVRSPVPNNGFPKSGDDIDMESTNMHLEKNVFRSGFKLGTQGPVRSDTSCGGVIANDCKGENHGPAESKPSAWANFNMPTSLYRAYAPIWWCQEACDFNNPHNGIGALGDDFSNGSVCKLPAQIRFEGGTCTPLTEWTNGSHNGQTPSPPYTPPPSGGGGTTPPPSGGGSGGGGTTPPPSTPPVTIPPPVLL